MADEEILALEKKRVDAILARDIATLEDLFDDEMLYFHSSSRKETKRSYLDTLKAGKSHYSAFDFSNVTVRRFGDCAIVSGDVIMTASSRHDLRFTNVWSKASGRWRNVHWASAKRAKD